MHRPASLPAAMTALLLAAGATPLSAAQPPAPQQRQQLEFELKSGSYLCEFGLRVDVMRDAPTSGNVHIAWNGRRYSLARDTSHSGLPRYEDRRNGLVWIDLPWKGVLLDARTQKPLANDCKTV